MLHWLVIIVLAVFVYRQAEAIRRLERRLDAALKALGGQKEPTTAETLETVMGDPRWSEGAPPKPAPKPAPAAPFETTPAPRPATARMETPAPRATAAFDPRFSGEPEPVKPPRERRTAISTWLAENGLAWIGGGGLALGGLLLVVYAAQQGVFTPPLRIAAAAALGAAMIAASEWILRQKQAPGGRHLLAAAVAAGAGAVTLYGAVCAAYALYDLIPFAAAAILTGLISLGLLALSLRHGEPLGLLALVGAAVTPWVTGIDAWPSTVLLAWALLIGVTGFTISAMRAWGYAALVTVIGLLVLALFPAPDGGALLILLAAVGPVAAVLWRRRQATEPNPAGRKVLGHQPGIAVVLTALAALLSWFQALAPGGGAPTAAALSGALVILGAAAAVRRIIPPTVFAAPVGSAVLAILLALTLPGWGAGPQPDLPWLHGLTALIPLAALIGALRTSGSRRTVLLGVGAVGAAVTASVGWRLMDDAVLTLPWAPAAVLGAALFLTAALIARTSPNLAKDRGLVLWLAAAAEMSFLALHAALPGRFEPLAFAAAALLHSLAARRLSWPGLAQTAVAGCLFSLAALFAPEAMGAALSGALPLPFAIGTTLLAAALLFAGARLMRRDRRHEAEAQATLSLLVLLTGLFAGLHLLLSGQQPDALSGELFRASVRTLLLLSAGLALTLRQAEDDGPIARWRIRLVIGAGVVHGALLQGLLLNPWWGGGAAPVGPPVLNTLLVSFLAPALLLLACGARRKPADNWSRAWTINGIAFGFLWLVMTLRHLFVGDAMTDAVIGRAEAAAYAVLLLLTARTFAHPRIGAASGLPQGLRETATPAGWLAIAVAVVVFGWWSSPWWGPDTDPMASMAHVALLFGLHALGAGAASHLRGLPAPLDRAGTAVATLILFVLMTLMIRAAFHGVDMGVDAPGGGLETWTFSALWALFGLGALVLGAGRHDVVLRWAGLIVLLVTAGKVLFFDLARLEGVTRAASFLAVGALFLAGALAARRLNRARSAEPDPDDVGT